MEYTYWLSSIISNVGVLITVFILNKYLFLFAIASSIGNFLINKKSLSKQYEIQKEVRTLQEKKTGLTAEVIRGIKDIKVLNASKTVLSQVENKIKGTTEEEIKMLNVRRKYYLLRYIISSLSDFLFIVLGCFLYTKGLLAIATFVIVYNYQSKVKNLLNGIGQLMEFNKKFIVSSSRIFEIIDDEKFSKEKFGHKEIQKLTGHIEFKDLSFGYENDIPILNDMCFEIKPNEKVAFVGKSGAGKTTVFNLLTKLYQTTDGKILLDGTNIDELDCDSIRNNMSIITQNPYIFNMSIKDNLKIANPFASDEELQEKCKLCALDDYIDSLENGIDTLVGENGVILSGGLKQRLSIARAILKNSKIIMLDEATSSLDNETQDHIHKSIKKIRKDYLCNGWGWRNA